MKADEEGRSPTEAACRWCFSSPDWLQQAARILKRPERQLYRLLGRLRHEGIQGLIHKNKGRPNPRKTPEKVKAKILALTSNELKDINDTIKDTRTVAKDHTVSFEGLVLQIPPSKKFHSLAGKRVEVWQMRDGSIEIGYKKPSRASSTLA